MNDNKPSQQAKSRVNGIVRVGPLMGIPPTLHELGYDPRPIFESAGFKLEQFSDPDITISFVDASRLLALCVETTGRQEFGLLLGMPVRTSSLGIAGLLLQAAPNVGKALGDLVRHFELHDQGGVVTLIIGDDITLFGYAVYQREAQALSQIYDLSISIACNIMRDLCGEDWNPSEVLLSRPSPADPGPYKKFFRAHLHFNASHNAIAFPSRWLKHQLPGADPLLHRYLEAEAQNHNSQCNPDLVRQLDRALRKLLVTQTFSAANAASLLHMHERTLNRRLREEGTSFRQELDKTRFEVAKQFLAESEIPLKKLAAILGYSDKSAFSRAFKRWSGTTPGISRVRHPPQ
jgi:AraC-like DNA-binding protein